MKLSWEIIDKISWIYDLDRKLFYYGVMVSFTFQFDITLRYWLMGIWSCLWVVTLVLLRKSEDLSSVSETILCEGRFWIV